MQHPRHLSIRNLRLRRVRRRVRGTSTRPRLHVFRSNRYLSAQIINDQLGRTLVSVNERELTVKAKTKTERAQLLGTLISQKAKPKKITSVCFDRGLSRYHGRIRAFADSARQGGLDF